MMKNNTHSTTQADLIASTFHTYVHVNTTTLNFSRYAE